MKKAKRNYDACERESFAVILAPRNFRVHLISKEHFTFISDHKSLKAYKRKDLNAWIARWLESLSECEFTVH